MRNILLFGLVFFALHKFGDHIPAIHAINVFIAKMLDIALDGIQNIVHGGDGKQ